MSFLATYFNFDKLAQHNRNKISLTFLFLLTDDFFLFKFIIFSIDKNHYFCSLISFLVTYFNSDKIAHHDRNKISLMFLFLLTDEFFVFKFIISSNDKNHYFY